MVFGGRRVLGCFLRSCLCDGIWFDVIKISNFDLQCSYSVSVILIVLVLDFELVIVD